VELLEAALGAALRDERVLPYLQLHEFEALVLAGLDALEAIVDDHQLAGVAALRTQIAGQAPEEVNDGRTTAPSKRLLACVPGYDKLLHGQLATEGAGLTTLRAKCPRFDAWVSRLEALAS
jgi:hypothetical protein